MNKDLADSTNTLHGARKTRANDEPVTPAVTVATSFFTHPDSIGFSASDLTDDSPFFYTRWGNPTIDLLERRLALLQKGEAAVAFASGMAAASALLFWKLKAGDHLILSNVCYAGVAELAHETLRKFGVEVTTVDASDPQNIARAITPKTQLVHLETPGNPILRLADISAIAEIAHKHGVEVSVDATIASPIGLKPLTLGADYEIHSLTKYVCGHGDALGGVVIGKKESIGAIRKDSLIHLGAALHPLAAWLILRGLETLSPRMLLHESNARRVAEFLEKHPRVDKVYWPGLPSHPQYELARRQMKNFSGLLAFTVKKDGESLARQLADRLKVISYAVSLGKTMSLLFRVPTEDILRTSFHMNDRDADAYRKWAGDGVFRLSVGLEDADDLIADLDQALK
jgi:cystathionine gamma-synthase